MINQTDYNFIKKTLLTTPNYLMDVELTMLNNKYVMDIYKLENHLRKQFGYDEEYHGNLSEFIEWKFGKRVLKKIEQLLFINH